jgi:mitochondrial import inner membrane translocase subunit TIM50
MMSLSATFIQSFLQTALPIVEKLDPYRFFTMYHLFRESTKSVNGEPVKDLSYLNRDLSKVIILDTHAEHVCTHPGNAIVMPAWKGTPGDRGLVDMIPFLECA